ncbi:hypothetical protein B0T24DRAFT_144361 [Lasiosphaeria ovina]|uniref:Uncharacterized protein n=1 Tax=Lasiosphaeria ovina TaxID=92902 RepID=A0AAE0ND49_9PEZI|nr:hypothetical protein B0T24DRAFT_144361 [Lasiosphaeria ovina]
MAWLEEARCVLGVGIWVFKKMHRGRGRVCGTVWSHSLVAGRDFGLVAFGVPTPLFLCLARVSCVLSRELAGHSAALASACPLTAFLCNCAEHSHKGTVARCNMTADDVPRLYWQDGMRLHGGGDLIHRLFSPHFTPTCKCNLHINFLSRIHEIRQKTNPPLHSAT